MSNMAESHNRNKKFNKKREKYTHKIKENIENHKNLNEPKRKSDSNDEKLNGSILEALSAISSRYTKRLTTHVSSGATWISQLISEAQEDKPVPLNIRKELKILAQRIYDDDVEVHKSVAEKRRQYGNQNFHKAIFSHGTTKDKIAAYTLQFMESPVYSVNNLFSLIDFVNPNNKTCQSALVDIASLFQTTILPDGHVAREFECHNFSLLVPLLDINFQQVEKQLLLWYYENQVRVAYLHLIEKIEKLCSFTQSKMKTVGIKGLKTIFNNHPHQDTEIILRKLINKLGDSNKIISGGVLQILSNIQKDQVKMKPMMVSLVEELLYRTNVSSSSQYSALCFLRDIIFTRQDDHLAEKLIKIYFDFFTTCSKKGEVDGRFMGSILRGLNRAFPYLEDNQQSFLNNQIEVLYKLCHYVNFNIGTQALQLVFQVQSSIDDSTTDRFYNVIYEKLLDPSYTSSSMKSALLNLAFRAIVRDTNERRIYAFVRRLLQISKYQPPEIACGTLCIISEGIKDNVILRKNMRRFLMTPQNKIDISVKAENGCSKGVVIQDDTKGSIDTSISSSKHKRKRYSHSQDGDVKELANDRDIVRTEVYDPRLRNPLFCGADLLPLWELMDLKNHFHPTVSIFSSTFLDYKFVGYSGDPLEDFALTRFLNRFIQKNPKSSDPEKNKLGAILGNRSSYVPKGARSIDIKSENFKRMSKTRVAPEDIFFHNYFTTYVKDGKKVKKEKKKDDVSDNESVDDDQFDQYLKSLNKVGGDDDGEDDNDEDFEQLDFAKNLHKPHRHGESNEDPEEGEDMMGSEEEEEDLDEDELVDQYNSKSEKLYTDDEIDMNSDEGDYDSEVGDDDFSEDEAEPAAKRAKVSASKKPESWGKWRDHLVDADEFSHILESNAMNDPYAGTSEAIFNKDHSSMKQLKWEENRHSSNYSKRFKKSDAKRNIKFQTNTKKMAKKGRRKF